MVNSHVFHHNRMIQIHSLKQQIQIDSGRSCELPSVWASSFVRSLPHCLPIGRVGLLVNCWECWAERGRLDSKTQVSDRQLTVWKYGVQSKSSNNYKSVEHQHHDRTLSLAQPLACSTCPKSGTATPTPRGIAVCRTTHCHHWSCKWEGEP